MQKKTEEKHKNKMRESDNCGTVGTWSDLEQHKMSSKCNCKQVDQKIVFTFSKVKRETKILLRRWYLVVFSFSPSKGLKKEWKISGGLKLLGFLDSGPWLIN